MLFLMARSLSSWFLCWGCDADGGVCFFTHIEMISRLAGICSQATKDLS